MMVVRPLFPLFDFDRPRVHRLLLDNVDDLNMDPYEADRRIQEIVAGPMLGAKLLLTGEARPDNGRAWGVALLRPGNHESISHTASLRLVVDRAHRGCGYGYRLLEEARVQAIANRITRIEAQPYHSRRSQTFWDRTDFTFEGTRRDAARDVHTGDLVDVDIWGWVAL